MKNSMIENEIKYVKKNRLQTAEAGSYYNY